QKQNRETECKFADHVVLLLLLIKKSWSVIPLLFRSSTTASASLKFAVLCPKFSEFPVTLHPSPKCYGSCCSLELWLLRAHPYGRRRGIGSILENRCGPNCWDKCPSRLSYLEKRCGCRWPEQPAPPAEYLEPSAHTPLDSSGDKSW